ncbi:DUF4276 family protein [Streptomonospora nanhaiensis]|uniref:DUF4276 family protein n=1 Tax=Streptomonospora nanhaiensis TaxID=1323731 RepID=A0ABY6YIJ0_9ACTN|nr:DUF4276 family protein [Streptomonospora nanhaiensis]WAE72032.1 DUF4276 family protein [Streptomonospora nanhaiensis]
MGGKRKKTAKVQKDRRPTELEVLVEEESAALLLRRNLRSWLGCGSETIIKVRPFKGKPALLQKLPVVLEGYAALRRNGHDVRVLVLVDQDADDCSVLKGQLEDMACEAGLGTRQTSRGRPFVVVNRMAVRELENWYFGDWEAVRSAFPKIRVQAPAEYRNNADRRDKKTSDVFEKMLVSAGIRNASKPDWADRVGPCMDPARNSSASFRIFLEGARSLVKEQQ